MNLLQLVNKAREKCSVSGGALTTVQGLTFGTESYRFLGWVVDEWIKIQEEHEDWLFLRQDFSFNTVAGQNNYVASTLSPSPLTNFSRWKKDSFRAYRASVGTSDEQLINFQPWDSFRNLYLYGVMRTTQQRPVLFTVAPNQSLYLGAVPDDVYTVNGEYYTGPVTLTADTDIPSMPDRYHMLLVFRVMMRYGAERGASEVYQEGENEASTWMHRLQVNQLPTPGFGAPLA